MSQSAPTLLARFYFFGFKEQKQTTAATPSESARMVVLTDHQDQQEVEMFGFNFLLVVGKRITEG